MLNLWKSSKGNKKLICNIINNNTPLTKLQLFKFSGGHHGHSASGSDHSDHEHDHEHDDHGDHHEHGEHIDHPIVSEGNYDKEARSRIFNKIETFSVDDLLSGIKTPITKIKTKIDLSQVSAFSSDKEYINFLAKSFQNKALQKYPEYKNQLEEYKHLIPNYESLNEYQKEVFSLDTYLRWELEKTELESREIYNFSGIPVERARQRLAFFQNLVAEDHHHDNRIMHHLKEQLKEVLQKELNYEEFKHKYNETMENQLINEIMEKKKKTFYYEISKNKTEIDKEIVDLKAPLNKFKFESSVTPHDHLNPQHYLSDPEKANEEKWKYLAYFDIIVDQHLRQVRPSSISEMDEIYKYVKNEFKPLRHVDDHSKDNMYWDYLYTLENEFYVKFKQEIIEYFDKNQPVEEPEDKVNNLLTIFKNRPEGKLWKEEHKFPHVADRIGWDFLQESPWDKNPFIERVESHPLYQFQPFVQVPSWEPNKDLCLEEGETIYENKYIFEWVLFWRLIIMLLPLPVLMILMESANNNTTPTPEYTSRFAGLTPTFNQTHRGLPKKIADTLNYWGSSMWYWQHWIRKSLAYIIFIGAAISLRKVTKIGNEYVTKAVYNRERDLVFVWRPTRVFGKEMHVYELHYLEQTVPKVVSSWKNLGFFKKDGVVLMHDLRLDHELVFYNEKKYWNIDEREHFYKNTTTFWRGLKHKDFNMGLFIRRSNEMNEEELLHVKKINHEIKNAIEKFGPVGLTDYEYNYSYQLKKRIQDIKRNLIEGKPVDTSVYRERQSDSHHNDHEHAFVKHSMH